jgi:hypothetical protein
LLVGIQFKFEFFCLSPFQNLLNHFPSLPFLLSHFSPSTFPKPSTAALGRGPTSRRSPQPLAGHQPDPPAQQPSTRTAQPAQVAASRSPAFARAAVANRWGPLVIPTAQPCPRWTRPYRAPPPSLTPARAGCLGPRVEDGSPGLFKPRRTPRVPHSSPSRPVPYAPPSPGTLTRRRCSPPPSSPHRQRGAVQNPRKEVRRPPDARVVDPARRVVRRSCRRTSTPCRAAPPRCVSAPPRPLP